MTIKNSDTHYGIISKFIHIIMALIMLFLLYLGVTMGEIDPSPEKWQAYGLHKSFGMTILALVIIRIIWKHIAGKPDHIATHKPWERHLATLTHTLLYLGMIAMPLSGWVMSSAGGHAISFFGLFEIPAIVGENKQISGIAHTIHEIAGLAILGAIGLHFLGAAKHHLLDKDSTALRMILQNRVMTTIVLIILGIALAIPTLYTANKIIADQMPEANDAPTQTQNNAETPIDSNQ